MSKQTAHDMSYLCAFAYSDNRHCRMPRTSTRSRYCEYHRRKLLPLRSSAEVTASLHEPIGQGFVPVTGLTQSLARLLACVAEGTVKAKDAVAITRVAETLLLKTIPLSDAEFKTIYLHEYRQQLLEDSFGALPPLQPPVDQDDDQDDQQDPTTIASILRMKIRTMRTKTLNQPTSRLFNPRPQPNYLLSKPNSPPEPLPREAPRCQNLPSHSPTSSAFE